MGDHTPNPIVFMVDSQDPHSRSGSPGRPTALGVGTETIDTTIQRDKHTVEIDHTDGAHIAVAHHILLQSFLIGVLHRLLHRGGHPGVVAVATVHFQYSYQHALARLVVLRSIYPALVVELTSTVISPLRALKYSAVTSSVAPSMIWVSAFPSSSAHKLLG